MVELSRIDGASATLVSSGVTNADGRVAPIVEGADFTAGVYELRFFCGDYLRSTGASLTEPPFLDVVPIRFGIGNPDQHYHVPLLVSAYGYSTYRGS